ncbi:hypothetical protein BDF22DRAFT_740838 [Syncephalis plumigaleata]|nr:hypothetical protein BDF22DRAFT_740838 [Syncephalis plumigaleata]
MAPCYDTATTTTTTASAHDPSSMVHDSAASTASSTSCSSSSNNDMRLPKPVASLAKMQKRRRTKANVAFAEEVEPSPVSSHAPLATSNLDKQQVNDPQLSRTIIDTTTTSASSSIIRPSTDSVATLHHHNNHYLQAPSSNDTWYNHHDGHSRWSIDASQANTPALTPSPTHQGFSSLHPLLHRQKVTAVMANEEDASSTSDTPNAITSPSKRSQSAALSTNEGGGEDTEAEDATDDVPTTQPRRLASCPEAPTRNPDEEANTALDSNVNTANNSVTDFTITADSSVYSIFEPMHAVPTGEYALSHAAEEARRQRRNRNKLHRPMGTAVNALLRKVFRPRKSSGHVAVKFFRRDTEQVRRELTLAQTLPAHPHLMQTLGVIV